MTDLLRSFPPVYRGDARLLVCGSLPGAASLAAGRYYAHPQNQFWRLIGSAIGRDLTALAYEARLAALAEARVALWDVVASGRREGSLDTAIRVTEAQDLAALVAALPALRAVAFNGGKAFAIGSRLLAGSTLPLLALPSSSPAYTLAFDAKRERWCSLTKYISGGELRSHSIEAFPRKWK